MKYLCFITILIGYSCQNVIKDETAYLYKGCEKESGFLIDTMTRKSMRSFILNNDYLNLFSFNNPSDTFFLRVETSEKKFVKIFEYQMYQSKPTFKIYRFPFNADKSDLIQFDKTTDHINDFTTVFDPSEKGEAFMKNLQENDILSLPDQDEIQGYTDETWSSGVHISYSNKCRFKIVFYTDIDSKSKKFKEAQSLVNFLAYLKNEFNF